MRAKTINFNREGSPLEKMNIGNPFFQLSKELNIPIEEIKKELKSFDIEGDFSPGLSDFNDFHYGVWAINDDPESYDISKESNTYKVASWAIVNIEKAYELYSILENIKESLNFNKEGSPLEKMKIGQSSRLKEISLESISSNDPDAREIKEYLCEIFEKTADNIFLLSDDIEDVELEEEIQKQIKLGELISGSEMSDTDIEVRLYETPIGLIAKENNQWSSLYWGDLEATVALNTNGLF
jgi:hypothetical protein